MATLTQLMVVAQSAGIGDRVQGFVGGIVQGVFWAVVAAAAVVFLLRRELSRLLGFVVIAMITGIFVFAPGVVRGLICDVGGVISGSGAC